MEDEEDEDARDKDDPDEAQEEDMSKFRTAEMKPVCMGLLGSLIDVDGDGLISPTELLGFLNAFGPLKKCVRKACDSLLYTSKKAGNPTGQVRRVC